jgi:3',5'-cyclic AMP phosphodiesterase CpdA
VAASARRRPAPSVIVALLTTLIALGCSSERTPSPEVVAGSPVVVAVGDIAHCRSEGDEATARLLGSIDGSTVLTLGDSAYGQGSAQNYEKCYDPAWGRFKGRTRPVPGNHDYYTEGAAGYFDYFGKAAGEPDKGYYSYDLGAWHLVALNSNCEEVLGGCGASSPQVRWLKADLAKDDKSCTLAYFHHPLFTSGKYRPGIPEVRLLWEALYAAGADVVLNGHDHNYQRFAPQGPDGRTDPEHGIREFVVGTGGKSHYAITWGMPGQYFPEVWLPMANIQAYDGETNGVLKLTLRPKGYEWRFIPAAGGEFRDSGGDQCH